MLSVLTQQQKTILVYNGKDWELEKRVTKDSQFVSNGAEVCRVVKQKVSFNRDMYNLLSLTDNSLLYDKFISIQALQVVFPYHATLLCDTVNLDFANILDLGISDREAKEFYNKYYGLYEVLQSLSNSDINNKIAIIKQNIDLIDTSSVGGFGILKELSNYQNQIEVVETIKSNIDNLHYLDSIDYDTSALYHYVVDNTIYTLDNNKVNTLTIMFAQNVYYNRNSF